MFELWQSARNHYRRFENSPIGVFNGLTPVYVFDASFPANRIEKQRASSEGRSTVRKQGSTDFGRLLN